MARCFFCGEEIQGDDTILVPRNDESLPSCIPCAVAEYDGPPFLAELYFSIMYDGDEALEKINEWRLGMLEEQDANTNRD